MAYERQGFVDDMVLTAHHLKLMENGIIDAESGIEYVESAINGKEQVHLRDLESGVYKIYGYFSPFKDSHSSIACDDLIHVARKDAGSHIMCISPLNAKLTFFEILVDETAPGGHTYTRQNFEMFELHALIEKVGNLEELTTEDKTNLVASINNAYTALNEAIDDLKKVNGLLTVETITVGESEDGETIIPVTSVVLDYTTLSLDVGDSMQLAASVLPSNATNNVILWETSNSSIATVDNGYVTAVTSGNVTITARSAENTSIYATCAVNVAAESGGASEKIQFTTLDIVANTLKHKNGNAATVSKGNYIAIPYSNGMQISTLQSSGWIANYPPFIVETAGAYSVPEYTTGESHNLYAPTGGMLIMGVHYTVTLSGYEVGTIVYVNMIADLSKDAMTDVMDTSDKYWYIPGGVS